MADLSSIERRKLERLLRMGGGYVLDFSDRTFSEFFEEHTRRDIDAAVYRERGTSKANRMRGFWVVEGNHLVGKVIQALILYGRCTSFAPRPAAAVRHPCRQSQPDRRGRSRQRSGKAEGKIKGAARTLPQCQSARGLGTARRLTAGVPSWSAKPDGFKVSRVPSSMRYPKDRMLALQKQAQQAQAAAPVDSGLSLEQIKFRYVISGDSPPSKPLRAFDDGERVYIQFPAGTAQGELPPLFVIGSQGDGQLVNYRFRSPYYVVDRLFGAAELRLGRDKAEVVRIERTDGVGSTARRH